MPLRVLVPIVPYPLPFKSLGRDFIKLRDFIELSRRGKLRGVKGMLERLKNTFTIMWKILERSKYFDMVFIEKNLLKGEEIRPEDILVEGSAKKYKWALDIIDKACSDINIKGGYMKNRMLFSIIVFCRDFGLLELVPSFLSLFEFRLKDCLLRRTLLSDYIVRELKKFNIADHERFILSLYIGLFFKTPARLMLSPIIAGYERLDEIVHFIEIVKDPDIDSIRALLVSQLNLSSLQRVREKISVLNIGKVTEADLLLLILGLLQLIVLDEYLSECKPRFEKEKAIGDLMLSLPEFLVLDSFINIEGLFNAKISNKIRDYLDKKIGYCMTIDEALDKIEMKDELKEALRHILMKLSEDENLRNKINRDLRSIYGVLL